MTDLYFTSDTHFSHKNVIQYSNRPFNSVEEMDETLIQNWNAVVKPSSTIWHLGDFCLGQQSKILEILQRLNGHKHLILGNHDKRIVSNPQEFMGVGLFESVQYYKELDLKPLTILFHYSARTWNKAHYGTHYLYGHSHGSSRPWGKSVDVGVDATAISPEYRPYHLCEIRNYLKNKGFVKMDHHQERPQ